MEGNAWVEIFVSLVKVLAPILMGLIMAWFQKRLGVEKMKHIQEQITAKQQLAEIAVRFVEQVYVDLHGEEKYTKAAEYLSTQAAKIGLTMDAEEVKALIESTLKTLKDEFGDAWDKTVTTK
ncbi:MAG: phage holin [Peptococcales bacterium]|jgi:LL-H family phage holin